MSETGRQSATFLKLSWEHASGATQSFHTILHTSTKDCKNAASLDLGVANKSWWVGEFRNVNYKTSKVQTTFGEDCVRIWKPPRCPDAQLSSLRRVLSDFGDPRDCSPPGSSVHGFLQARFLEWVATSFSRGPFWPRDWTHISSISCFAGRFFICWASSLPRLWSMRMKPTHLWWQLTGLLSLFCILLSF